LVIDDVISKDEGLYSLVARNPAGAVSASAMIHVEDNEDEFEFTYRTYHRGRNVKTRQVDNNRIFFDYYELGRGMQDVTYHSVERSTVRSFASKIITETGPEFRSRMTGELEIMNRLSHQRLVRLIDSSPSWPVEVIWWMLSLDGLTSPKTISPTTSAKCWKDLVICTATESPIGD
jgi:hypothetical protein